MTKRKTSQVPLAIEARLRALHASRVNELRGVREWITACKAMLQDNPDDRWIQGMLRHYLMQEERLAKAIEGYEQKKTDS